jgi:hypothetical protein
MLSAIFACPFCLFVGAFFSLPFILMFGVALFSIAIVGQRRFIVATGTQGSAVLHGFALTLAPQIDLHGQQILRDGIPLDGTASFP